MLPWVRILQHNLHHEVFGWLPFFKFSFGSELPSSGQHFVPSINTILSGLTNLCKVCTEFIIRNKRQDLGPWFLVSEDILIHQTQLLKILLDNADCPLYTWMHAALQSHFLKSINCKFWAMIFTLSPKMLCPTLLHCTVPDKNITTWVFTVHMPKNIDKTKNQLGMHEKLKIFNFLGIK